MIPRLPDEFIGVFDSGIGGLSVADAICGRLPEWPIVYVADNAYAPYGPRHPAEIVDRSRRITHWLLDRGACLIVIACNSATAAAVRTLRAELPGVTFVAMEPAVKPAAAFDRVGVIATAATLGSDKYGHLRGAYLGDRYVWEYDCPGLVTLIEEHGPEAELVRKYLVKALAPAAAQKIDALVLGCTHYLFLKPILSDILGPKVTLIDPAVPTAHQVERQFPKPGSTGPGRHNFCATGSALPLQRTLLTLPDLNRHRRWLIPGLEV